MEMMSATPTSGDRARLLRAALDGLLDPCVVLEPVRDTQGTIIDFTWVDANRAACEYNGIPFDDLMGLRLCELLPNQRSSGAFDEFVQVVETGRELLRLDHAFPVDQVNGAFRRFDMHGVEADGNLVLTWRDCTARYNQAATLAESERRFRILAGAASDVVYETDRDGQVLWVSPSVEHVLGWKPAEWLGRLASDMVVPEDLRRMREHRDAVVDIDEDASRIECRYLMANGDRRWTSVYAHPIFDDHGGVTGGVVGLRDIQTEMVARRAALTVSAGNAALVRAQHEEQLLFEMCEIAVEKGGYLFAWYGRPAGDERKSVRATAWSRAHRDYLDSVEVSWGDGPLGQGPSGTCIRMGQPRVVADFRLDPSYQPWIDAASKRGFRSSVSLPVFVDGAVDGAWMVYAAEPNAFDHRSVTVLLDLTAQLGYGLSRLRDLQRLALALDEQRLLGTAIDQATEAVVVTDTTPAIRYVNPAALRLTGYTADEVIGRNPSIFKSGFHDEAFY
jgi:PAS domain S-box-containing protein